MYPPYSPKVSIITPLFNRVTLIGETITSVLAQSYQNWEMIIVDDGSTDGSLTYVEKISESDKRIFIIPREKSPKGAPTCRNIGVEKAVGEFLIFLDSDDILAPYCLEERIRFMNSHPDLDFAVFLMLMFTEQPGDSNVLWNIPKTKSDDLERFLTGDHPWAISCPIWKTKVLSRVEPWDGEALSWQDWAFHIRALMAGLEYKWGSEIPDNFVRRSDQIRISKNDKSKAQLLSRAHLFTRILNSMEECRMAKPRYKKLLAGHLFLSAESIIKKKIDIDFSHYYKSVKRHNLLSFPVYWTTFVYLHLWYRLRNSRFKVLAKRLFALSRIVLPWYMVDRKSDHLKLKLDPKIFKVVKSKCGALIMNA